MKPTINKINIFFWEILRQKVMYFIFKKRKRISIQSLYISNSILQFTVGMCLEIHVSLINFKSTICSTLLVPKYYGKA